MQPEVQDLDVDAQAYEAPAFVRQDLRVITLGGTPGAGDSGAPTTENPPGGGDPNARKQSFEEDWDNGDGKP
jgi:hypothetical protein